MVLSSCDAFLYSPNEVRVEEQERDINAKNIQRLSLLQASDTLKFVLIGDTQRFYEETDAFVRQINGAEDVDFVILAGDITDFGLNKEFKWVNERLSRLKVPYITVIGNHDMLANGREVYRKMYGAENFSFTVNGNTFICLNTNSEEVGFDGTLPDMNWLTSELGKSKNSNNVFVISHVPPFSAAFDKSLEQSYADVLKSNRNVRLSLHGHQHYYSLSNPYNGGCDYLVVGSMNKKNYAVVSVAGGKYNIEEKQF